MLLARSSCFFTVANRRAIEMVIWRLLKVKAFVLALCCAALLAGCAKPLEVSSITQIRPTNGAQGIDVYSERRNRGEKVPEYAGDQLLQVRTYRGNDDGVRGKEFAGATCDVQASNFKASVTTPAKVRVPIYRAKSSTLSIRCEHPGYKPKLIEASVYNKTQSDRLSAGANGGLAGVLVMAAVNGMSDSTLDNYYYAPAQVIMTPLPRRVARKVN